MNFTKQDFLDAIDAGIIDERDNVTSNPTEIIMYFEKWANRKAKEIHRNVRHEAASIVNECIAKNCVGLADNKIMNISLKNND